MYGDILVPTDGSEGIAEVLPHAISLAEHHDARIHTLYVVDRRHVTAADDRSRDEVREGLEAEGQAAVAAVREAGSDAGLEVHEEVVVGIPYREILEYVDSNAIDVVVIGTHGRTGRDRLVHLGSVTERVVKNTSVPVFVVNIDESDTE